MNQRIIYPTDDGGIAIIIPIFDCGLSVEAIAAKDVPAGKPFKIVSASDIPSDREDRCAWTVDEQLLTDGVGADYGAGSDWAVVDWDGDGKPDALVNVITGETKKVGAA